MLRKKDLKLIARTLLAERFSGHRDVQYPEIHREHRFLGTSNPKKKVRTKKPR